MQVDTLAPAQYTNLGLSREKDPFSKRFPSNGGDHAAPSGLKVGILYILTGMFQKVGLLVHWSILVS